MFLPLQEVTQEDNYLLRPPFQEIIQGGNHVLLPSNQQCWFLPFQEITQGGALFDTPF